MKKYQIFVSSTYEDLKEQRSEVTKAILKLGHIPVGMEMFNASDESQWKLIQRQIDDSDYYVIIVAHRYGSRDLDGKSYTEKEYDYAASKGIPILGFIIHQDTEWLPKFIDKGKDQASLSDFKEKVKTKMVEFWSSKEMLQALVISSISVYINGNPRIGWVRAHEGNDSSVLNEVSRLSSENAALRNEIALLNANLESVKNEKIDSIMNALNKNEKTFGFKYRDAGEFTDKVATKYFDIFRILAPELWVENSLERCSMIVAVNFAPNKGKKLATKIPVGNNVMRSILGDFIVLDLITAIEDNNKNGADHYKLTELGKDIFKKIRSEYLIR